MPRRVLLNVVAFAVASLVMTAWAVGNIVSVDRLEKPYDLSVELANAFGVGTNAEVTYLGVSYGSIKGIDRVPGGVVARMKIKRDRLIPVGAVAHVLRKSVIGEPYIDFAPPEGYTGDGGPFHRDGDRVPKERTTVPLEFSELLRSADALLASVPPDDVGTLLREASIGLQGRADSLRTLAEAGDRLSASLAARSEALDRLATNGTRLTKVVSDHRTSLGRSLTDLRALAQTLKDARGDTAVLLDDGSKLLTQLADIVAKHKGNLDCDLKTLEMVTDVANTDTRPQGLAALLDIGPRAFAGVWDSTDVHHGTRWLRVGLTGGKQNLPDQFVPPKELPAVPVVPPCTSPLRPVSVAGGAAARAPGTSDSGPLPATGGGPVAGVGAAFLAAMLVVRRLRLRSSR